MSKEGQPWAGMTSQTSSRGSLEEKPSAACPAQGGAGLAWDLSTKLLPNPSCTLEPAAAEVSALHLLLVHIKGETSQTPVVGQCVQPLLEEADIYVVNYHKQISLIF